MTRCICSTAYLSFNKENYDKAEELLRPIEKRQPSAAYLLSWESETK